MTSVVRRVARLRPRLRGGLRAGAVPAVVWLIVALHFAITLCQTAVFPNIRSPDELQHVDLIVQVHEGEAWPWPGPGGAQVTAGTEAGGFMRTDGLPGRRFLADRDDIPPPRSERESYVEAGGTAVRLYPTADDDPHPRNNQLVQHPPLYYLVSAAVLDLIPDWDGRPFDQTWLLLRWWNAVLMAALPLLMWAIARRLRLADPLPVAAALVPLAIPEMTHLESAVNNDNLLVMLGAVATLLVVRVLTGDLGRRTAVLLGIVTTLALLTKGFALLMPAWITLAYAVAGFRHRRRRAAFTSLVVVGVAAVPGALWWLRNLVVYGRIQPNGYRVDSPALTPIYGWDDGGPTWLARISDRLATLFFVQDHAALQRHDASWWMSRVALTLVVLGLVVVLLRRVLPRRDALVLAMPTVALVAIVASGSWEQFAANHNFAAGQQGRYLYLGMPALMAVAVAGGSALRPRLRRAVPLALLGLAGAMHLAYQYDTWWLYWVPEHGTPSEQFRRAAETIAFWYPFGPTVLAVILGATVILAAAVMVAVVRIAWPLPPYTSDVPPGDDPRPLPELSDRGRV